MRREGAPAIQQSSEAGAEIAELAAAIARSEVGPGILNMIGSIGPNARSITPVIDEKIGKHKGELPAAKMEIDKKNYEYFIRRLTEIKAMLNPEPQSAGGGKARPKRTRK